MTLKFDEARFSSPRMSIRMGPTHWPASAFHIGEHGRLRGNRG